MRSELGESCLGRKLEVLQIEHLVGHHELGVRLGNGEDKEMVLHILAKTVGYADCQKVVVHQSNPKVQGSSSEVLASQG